MGVPAASVLVPLSGIIALLGGLSILLGYKAKIGAWLLVIFLVPTAFMMHKFWAAEDGFASMMQHYCFMKNMSLLGASLMIAYFGSGPLSLSKKGRK
jgi:putative oxidoreductase